MEDLDMQLGNELLKTGDFKSMKGLLPKPKKTAKVSRSNNLLSEFSGKEYAT